jgi:hypothetical protein
VTCLVTEISNSRTHKGLCYGKYRPTMTSSSNIHMDYLDMPRIFLPDDGVFCLRLDSLPPITGD